MKKDNKPKGSNILYLIYYILFFLIKIISRLHNSHLQIYINRFALCK